MHSTPLFSNYCKLISMAIPLPAHKFSAAIFNSSNSSTRTYFTYVGRSLRAIPMRVITVGKKRDRGVQLIVEEYMEKLRHYCSIDDVIIRSNPKNARDVKAQIKDEDSVVTNLIKPDDWVIIMDEYGIEVSSEQFAKLIGDAVMRGFSRLLICIGGPYGHGTRLRNRANQSIKLSSLVLNHQIALVVLMEQLFRAWTILKGQKYHH